MEKTELLIRRLQDHQYDELIEKLVVDPERVQETADRYIRMLTKFREMYGDREVGIFSAPGRTEVGGNHTDHQCGEVLAASVNLDTVAVAGPRADRLVRLKSEGYPAFTIDLSNLSVVKEEEGSTMALIRGVAAGMEKRGFQTGGFDAYVTSQVLSGSGLSSSAAFEVLIGNIFSGLFNAGQLSQVEIAKISQEAENVYFGKPSGLMDQMASAVGSLVHIDFGDPQKPVIDPVKVDFAAFGHCLCIVDTHGSHADLTEDYAAIPIEMKRVANYFGAAVLKQVDEETFYAHLPQVREEAGDRAVLRAIHYYNENRRVQAQVEALRKGDFEVFKSLIRESGNSSFKYLQNVYASHKVQHQAVSLALAVSEKLLEGEGVCRVHGGGFAGTIQVFVPTERAEAYKEGIERVFGAGSCYVLNIRPVGGTRIL